MNTEAEVKAMIAAMTPEERKFLLAEMERSQRDQKALAGATPEGLAAYFIAMFFEACKLRAEGRVFEGGFAARSCYAATRAIGGVEEMRAALVRSLGRSGVTDPARVANTLIAKQEQFSVDFREEPAA